MATAIAPRQTSQVPAQPVARWIDDARTLGVALSSDGHTLYRITRTGDAYACECDGNAKWGKQCRHIALLRPATYCSICHTEVVRVAGDACTGCAHVYGTQALAVAPSTDAEIAASEAIKAEIRAELVSAPADTFLARLRATPSPAERNALALQRHGMSAGQGTRIERAGDPLAAWGE